MKLTLYFDQDQAKHKYFFYWSVKNIKFKSNSSLYKQVWFLEKNMENFWGRKVKPDEKWKRSAKPRTIGDREAETSMKYLWVLGRHEENVLKEKKLAINKEWMIKDFRCLELKAPSPRTKKTPMVRSKRIYTFRKYSKQSWSAQIADMTFGLWRRIKRKKKRGLANFPLTKTIRNERFRLLY